jgi:gliding motility-associated-like protein
MKSTLLATAIIFFTHILSGQVIYVSATNNTIYRLTIDDCAYTFLVQVDRQVYDISFHPNGTLYGISGNGTFFVIDTLTGQTTNIHFFTGQSFNSLAIDADGLVYTIGNDGELWTYNLVTDMATFLGDIGYDATGDLAFYKGNFYVAVTGDRIVQINLGMVTNSSVVINEDIPGNILGIVSDVVDCKEINCYAITNGNSDIYQIDFTTNSLQLICELNITVGGGASSSEFLGSSPIQIDSLLMIDPNCRNEDGAITVSSSGGSGAFQYSINGSSFQLSNTFSNLSGGNYTIKIIDQRGCEDSLSITLTPASSPILDTIILHPSTCGEMNGSLEVVASGGTGELQYILDSIVFQSTGVFTGLDPDRYEIFVVDEAGCIVKDDALIHALTAASIILTDISNTTCGDTNGIITITTDEPVDVLYSIDGLHYQTNNQFTDLSADTYSIIIQDSSGCHDTLSVVIGASTVPVIDTIITQPETCGKSNGSLFISASGGAGSYQYSIDGNTFHIDNSFINLSAGHYDIQIIDEDGCSNVSTAELTSLSDLKIVSINIEPTLCGQRTGLINISIEGGIDPVTISLNDNPAQTEETFSELTAGIYKAHVHDGAGCVLDTTLTIAQTECPVYIPNIFSPNGDGINDVFQIQTADKNEIMITRFYIFDRWGNKVYERFNIPIQSYTGWWDGTFKRFTMNPGAFAYYLEVQFENGTRETYKGSVTLIR